MHSNYLSPWWHELIDWCFIQHICTKTLINYWTKQQICVFMTKHVLLLDAGNTICCHTWETPKDSESSEQNPWVVDTETCWASEAQVLQRGPSKSPMLKAHSPPFAFKTLPLNTSLHTTNRGYFHFSTWSVQACSSVQDFPNKNRDFPSPCGFSAWKSQTLPFQSLC